jgi:MFS family permease
MFSLKSDEGIFYGWWVVTACSILTFYGAGMFFYGFTVFVHPMAKELGWSMALISGAFSLYRLESGIAAPLAGFMLDRIGPRMLVVAGGLIWGTGFIYLSHVRTVFEFYIAFLVISFGWTFASGTAVPSALIAKWFVKKRGRALGIFTGVSGLSGLLVPILSYLIDIYGWQRTLLIMGFFTFLVTTPLSFTLRHRPEDHGLLPDGKPSSIPPKGHFDADASGYMEVDFDVRKALITPAFWFLSLASTIFYMTMSALFVHIVPHLISAGIEARVAALAVMFITLCSVLGRAGFGWLSDILNKKWLLVSAFLLQGVGLFIFSQVHQVIHLIPFVLTYAPSYGGGIVLRAAITGEYYGRKNFGTIYGIIVGMGTFGGIAGPVIAGFAYDFSGNFRLVFAIFALVSFLSALLLLPMKRPSRTSNTNGQI